MMEQLITLDWLQLVYASATFIFGFFLAKLASRQVDKQVEKRFSKHQAMLARRLVFYGLFIIFVISALQQLNFKMSVFIGAAGVFTLAISFASQTAASNLVSGIFLIFEHPFKVGDVIEVKGSIRGTVDSIDLLSTKIKTADNQLIRVPNETIMKSDITNMTYFKTRRVDITIGVAYDTDIEKVKAVLTDIARKAEGIILNPPPLVVIQEFQDSVILLKLMLWTKPLQVLNVKYAIHEAIKRRFDEEKIEMPFPQLVVHQSMPS